MGDLTETGATFDGSVFPAPGPYMTWCFSNLTSQVNYNAINICCTLLPGISNGWSLRLNLSEFISEFLFIKDVPYCKGQKKNNSTFDAHFAMVSPMVLLCFIKLQ